MHAGGSGFGKTILIGDQFVLREVPAIVAALPDETVASVEPWEGTGWTLQDKRREVPGYKDKKKHQQTASVNRILEVMKIDVDKHPLKITLAGSLLAGSGVGASAAGCVALARALASFFERDLTAREINHIAWEGEFPYHGIPSGIDNTISTFGGLIQFWIKRGNPTITPISTPAPLRIVLAASGITSDTSTLDDFVKSIRDRDPKAFARTCLTIEEQSLAMKQALETGNLARVGTLMTANHQLLIALGLSHPRLEELAATAQSLGALGAKLTGGGRGGYLLVLAPDSQVQERIARGFEDVGVSVIRATIGDRETSYPGPAAPEPE